jgi:hypothetical protein
MPKRCVSQFTKPIGPGLTTQPVLRKSAPIPETGIVIATRDTKRGRDRESCSASPYTPRARHTGAGNRATAVSHSLTRHQCQQVLWASARASMAGTPFNRHTTFHHGAMGIPDTAGHDALAALIKLCSDFLATKGQRLRWAYTRENGPEKGPHAHILWHVPPQLARAFFGRWLRWKAKLAQSYAKPGVGRGGRVCKTRCIGGSSKAYRSNPQAFAFHLDQAIGYALKGADPVTIAVLALTKSHEASGAITGKRAGWWREYRRRNYRET